MAITFRTLVCLCAALFELPYAAAAQSSSQPPPPPPGFVETVEVVATRLPESPHDVPASVEVLTGADLQSLGATTLRDALAAAAGVEVAPGGESGPAGAVPECRALRELDAAL